MDSQTEGRTDRRTDRRDLRKTTISLKPRKPSTVTGGTFSHYYAQKECHDVGWQHISFLKKKVRTYNRRNWGSLASPPFWIRVLQIPFSWKNCYLSWIKGGNRVALWVLDNVKVIRGTRVQFGNWGAFWDLNRGSFGHCFGREYGGPGSRYPPKEGPLFFENAAPPRGGGGKNSKRVVGGATKNTGGLVHGALVWAPPFVCGRGKKFFSFSEAGYGGRWKKKTTTPASQLFW